MLEVANKKHGVSALEKNATHLLGCNLDSYFADTVVADQAETGSASLLVSDIKALRNPPRVWVRHYRESGVDENEKSGTLLGCNLES
jgi:hypothetical protein